MAHMTLPGCWVAVAFAFALVTPAAADEPPGPPADPARALIDRLVGADRQDTGYSAAASGTAFLPLGQIEWGAALLAPRQGEHGPSDALRALVELGARAVPVLLAHLSDDRPTKIVIAHSGGFGGLFVAQDEDGWKADDRGEVRYTVRVGDLCYVALGQIVNRPYTAVRYQPTALVFVTSVPRSRKLRAGLTAEWGRLTAAAHRDSLARDFASDHTHTRTGAAVRLGYYYPDALDGLVLRQLARPAYDPHAVDRLLRDRLYPAKTAAERRELARGFVARHGEVARDGLRWELFDQLDSQIADEEGRHHPPYGDKRPKARECLTDVFGSPAPVTPKDRPTTRPLSVHDQGALIDALIYDRSEAIDRAVRDRLATTDSGYMGFRCLRRLVGRGYDADIEAYLRRRRPAANEWERESLDGYRAKLGWSGLHRAVDLELPVLVVSALRDGADVNGRARDGRTPLHLAAEGKAGAVEQLLAAGADPNVTDAAGTLPAQVAARADHVAIVRRLVTAKSAVPDALTAAAAGDTARLGELLKVWPAGAKARTEAGFTPVHLAAREGHVGAVGVLLAAGAEPGAVDLPGGEAKWSHRLTPLHLAAGAGRDAVVRLLLDWRAAVNAADRYGQTPCTTPPPAVMPGR